MVKLLCPGDRGEAVRELQSLLMMRLCVRVVIDGVYGPKTKELVQQFQKSQGLTVDGIAGPKTLAALGFEFKSASKKLVEQDYIDAALWLGVEVAAVKAVAEVEAASSAFLDDGRCKILFERHQFHKHFITPRKPGETVESLTAIRATIVAKHPDICNPSRGGYKGNEAEYPRLALAQSFSDTAALMSASYGMFQIMGFNYKAAGFEDVQSMERVMQMGEREHLNAFCAFIKADPRLHRALKSLDWATFARWYNGPAYRDGKYDEKMVAAFKKHSR